MYCHICIGLPIVLSEIDILYILPSFGMHSLYSVKLHFLYRTFPSEFESKKVNKDKKKTETTWENFNQNTFSNSKGSY